MQDIETSDAQTEQADDIQQAETIEEPVSDSQTTGPRLVLKRAGAETDIVFSFSPPATIGRFDPSVGPIDIDLGQVEEGSFVSRKHAKIVSENGALFLEDLGSSNGTFVLRDDFVKIEREEIKSGDEIAFGNARFVFYC